MSKKTVFVTGANKGIGFGIAKHLGLGGWQVIIGARDEQRATKAINELKALGIDARIIVPEKWDVSLAERVRRVNTVCRQAGTANVALVSIHVNAAGSDGQWHDASGFTVWVAKACSEASKRLARLMYDEAERRDLKGNRSVPRERYWQADFAMVKSTSCPAVLTENLFQDNKKDVAFLLTERGKQAIVDLHVAAIMKYLSMQSPIY